MTNNESDTPWHRLENRLTEMLGVLNLHAERIADNRKDLDELKKDHDKFLTKETFEFYSRAFWILATAVGTGLIGSIFYVITNRG